MQSFLALEVGGKILCHCAHANTTKFSKWPTDLSRLNITANNRNVEPHNICLGKIFDRDKTSLNLTKQDTT